MHPASLTLGLRSKGFDKPPALSPEEQIQQLLDYELFTQVESLAGSSEEEGEGEAHAARAHDGHERWQAIKEEL